MFTRAVNESKLPCTRNGRILPYCSRNLIFSWKRRVGIGRPSWLLLLYFVMFNCGHAACPVWIRSGSSKRRHDVWLLVRETGWKKKTRSTSWYIAFVNFNYAHPKLRAISQRERTTTSEAKLMKQWRSECTACVREVGDFWRLRAYFSCSRASSCSSSSSVSSDRHLSVSSILLCSL